MWMEIRPVPKWVPAFTLQRDGSSIPLQYLQAIREMIRQQPVLFDWQRGDLLPARCASLRVVNLRGAVRLRIGF